MRQLAAIFSRCQGQLLAVDKPNCCIYHYFCEACLPGHSALCAGGYRGQHLYHWTVSGSLGHVAYQIWQPVAGRLFPVLKELAAVTSLAAVTMLSVRSWDLL